MEKIDITKLGAFTETADNLRVIAEKINEIIDLLSTPVSENDSVEERYAHDQFLNENGFDVY